MNWKLIIEDDVGETVEVPLRQDVTTIGRKDGNMIKLTERNVSRDHALLIRDNGSLFVEDLKSYTGVKINGERIQGKVQIQEGDLIEIGDYHLALQQENAGAAKAPLSQAPGMQSLNTSEPLIDESVAKDDFAGETERWVPPQDMPPLERALPTVQEGKPVLAEPQAAPPEKVDATIPTVAEAMPISSGGSPQTEETVEALPVHAEKAQGANGAGDEPQGAHGDHKAEPSPLDGALNEGFAQSNETQPFQKPDIDTLAIENPIPEEPPTSPPIGDPNVLSDLEETELDAGAGLNIQKESPTPPVEASSAAHVEVREVVDQTPSQGDRQVPPVAQSSEPPESHAAQADEQNEIGLGHRLYVVNSALAGTIYDIDKEEMVLGRVDENDIVMDHRSISRNHAKVHLEDGIARIVDLKSANGIFLNGNEVDQAILRSGDIIELGRVQIRYLIPNEEYQLSPYEIKMAVEADVATESSHTPTLSISSIENAPPRQKQPVLVILLATIIILLLCILALVLKGGGDRAETTEEPPKTMTAELTDIEQKAEQLEKQGKYREVEQLLVPLIDSKDPLVRKRVKVVLARIQDKIPAQSQLRDLQNALDKQMYKDAVTIGEAVQPGTDAFDRAKDLVAIARQKGLVQSYEQGILALQENNRSAARSALEKMEWFNKTHDRTQELRDKIAKFKEQKDAPPGAEAKKQKKVKQSASAKKRSSKSSRSAKKKSSSKDEMSDSERKQIAQGLLKNAKGHMFRADWRAALKELEKAKQFDSSEAEIYSRLGAVYTALKRPSKAVANYKRFLQLKPYDRSRDRIRAQIKELEKEL